MGIPAEIYLHEHYGCEQESNKDTVCHYLNSWISPLVKLITDTPYHDNNTKGKIQPCYSRI
jgi:hypothetical protein